MAKKRKITAVLGEDHHSKMAKKKRLATEAIIATVDIENNTIPVTSNLAVSLSEKIYAQKICRWQVILQHPESLIVFTAAIVRSIQKSFFGVPAAAIIISADQIIGASALLILPSPEKILIILIALILFIAFLIESYRDSANLNVNKTAINKIIDEYSILITILAKDKEELNKTSDITIFEKKISSIKTGSHRISYLTNDRLLDTFIALEKDFNQLNKTENHHDKLLFYINKTREIMYSPNKYNNDINILDKDGIDDQVLGYCQKYTNAYAELDKESQITWHEMERVFIAAEEEQITIKNTLLSRLGIFISDLYPLASSITAASIGLIGMLAVLSTIFPSFSLPIIAIIIIAAVFFICFYIQAKAIGQPFVLNGFNSIAKFIKIEKLRFSLSYSILSYAKLTIKLIQENIFQLITSLVFTVSISIFISIGLTSFLATLALPAILALPIIVFVVIITALCLLAMISQIHHIAYIENTKNIQNSNDFRHNVVERLWMTHRFIAIAIFLAIITICLILGIEIVITAIISTTIASALYLGLAFFRENSTHNNEYNKDIIGYRVREISCVICSIAVAISVAISITQIMLFSVAPNPVVAAIVITVITILVTISTFNVVTLLFWYGSFKPEKDIIQDIELGKSNTSLCIATKVNSKTLETKIEQEKIKFTTCSHNKPSDNESSDRHKIP